MKSGLDIVHYTEVNFKEILQLMDELANHIEQMAATAAEQLASMEEITIASQALSSRSENLQGLISKFNV
ncbi:hypothetical protein [Bacillus sp. FJAT-52991]|uniref:Methyl-accepting chemotaxis protein n=1 Tax=Bacillus kandeliae TaxID=3129297 RepID=A0ABZ2N664_9BACI